MDQIKSLITPSKFKVWVRHVETHTRNERFEDDVIGHSYLKGIWDKKANAYRATKFHVHPEFRDQGYQIDLFRAALELLSSHHKKLISDDVITGSQRKHIDEVIQQGHVRKDLPFGNYLLDSPRRKVMTNRTARSKDESVLPFKKKHHEELSRYPMKRDDGSPNVTRKTEAFIWSMGDALTRALREPQGDRVGDNRFWVSGLSTRTWSILHPDLEMLEYGESPLILRIKKVGDNKWDVEGQNQLQNLKNKVVLKTETTPPVPNKTWEIDYIAAVAAKYFLKEKDKIMELKQAMQPQQSPGSSAAGPPPEGGGEAGGGMPGMGAGMPGMAASRRAKATLTNLHRAQDIVAGLRRRYSSAGWFRDARVLNDRHGIGIAVHLKSLPEKRLKASLAGIPVYWQHANKRIATGEPKGSPEMSQKDLVNLIHTYLLPPRRSFKSPVNLARRLKKQFDLKIELDKLVMMIGKLMSNKKLNFSNGRFKAIKPEDDLVAVRANTSLYRLDKGNWRHRDGLDSTMNTEILTQDAPEEKNNAYSNYAGPYRAQLEQRMQLTQDYRRVRANWGNDGDFITPEGKVIHVGDNHSVFMMKHPKLFNGVVDPGEIVGEGWIRTRMMYGTFSIDARGGLTGNQLQVLQKIVHERYHHSDPRIEVATDDGDVYQWKVDDFITMKYPNQVKRRGLRSSRQVQANWGTDGDFITPEGKVIHVGENHTIFMMDHPEIFGGSDDPDDMVGQGWVQTRMISWIFSVKADGGMNQTQLEILQKMVRERCQFSDPHIQVLMPDENLYNLTCDDFIDIEYPGQIKRRGLNSSRRRIAAERNYWVGPDGKIIPLEGGYTHAYFASKHPKVFGNLSQEAIKDGGRGEGDKIVDEVIALGWCRVMGWGVSMNVQFGSQITDSQLKSLKEVALLMKPNMVLFGGNHPRHHAELDPEHFLEVDYPAQLFRMGRFSARAVPFITKEDLRFSREGDPWVDPDWLESGLKRLLTIDGEHFSYSGKKKRDRDRGLVFLYRAGQMSRWIGKDHKVYKEGDSRGK